MADYSFLNRCYVLLIIFACVLSNAAGAQTTGPVGWTYDPFANSTHIGLTGTVSLPDGKPATAAIVELVNGMDPETSTTVLADGSFALPYPNSMAGPYSIRIRKPGYATKRFEFPSGKTLPAIKLEPMATISGTVKSPSGAPLEDVTVTISTVMGRRGPRGEYIHVKRKHDGPGAHEKTRTDSEGRFAVDALEDGDYNIQAYAPGLRAYTGETSAPAANLEIILAPASGIIRGTTIDYATGQPLGGTTVTVSRSSVPPHGSMIYQGQTTVSDSLGRFEFTGLEYVPYGLTARRPVMLEVPSSQSDPSGARLSERQPAADVNVRLYPGHTVSGVVRDAKTKNPLADVKVSALSINNIDVETLTDKNGHYRLEHVVGGGGDRLFLQAKKDGYDYATTGGGGTKIPEVVLTMDNTEVPVDVDLVPESSSSGKRKPRN